jgi:membrane protein required for colicin V production
VNWLDWFLLLMALSFAVHGAMRGLTRQVIGLAAMLLGLLLASWFYGTAGSFLIPYVSHKGIANLLGFLIVFVGVQTVGALAGWAVAKLVKTVGLSWIDRLFGIGFGLLKGALAGVVMVTALSAFSIKPLPESVAESRFAPVLVEAGRIAAAMAPKELSDGFDRSYQNLKKFWEEQVRPQIDKKVKDSEALPGTSA